MERGAGQGTAALNGVGDALTLGFGKPVGASLSASFGGGNGATFADRYKSIRQQQDVQQLYEQQHYPVARDIGLGLGTAAAVLASDGLAEVPAAARLAPMTIRKLGSTVPRTIQRARLIGATAGAGAGTGVLGQATVDLAQGRLPRPSALAGAAAGGAVAGPALLYKGPGTAAAVEATVNHGVQSALQGEPMPWDKVQQDTAAGSLLGFGVGALSDAHLQNMPWQQKGKLGETLSAIKSSLLGDPFIETHQPIPVSGGKTIADGLLGSLEGLQRGVEAKFGIGAGLSPRQTEALRELGPAGRYYVDHFLPADGAKAVGGVAAIGGAQASCENNDTEDQEGSDPDDED